MSARIIFIIITVLLAVMFFCRVDGREGMSGITGPRCPNLLIQKGCKIYLHNTKIAEVPGVNPIEFNNLEEYTQFIDWQRSQGIRCPVLYLQETYDSQGNMICKVRPCTVEPQGGLPPETTSECNSTSFCDDSCKKNSATGPSVGCPRYQNLERQLLLDSGHDDPPFNRGGYPAHDPSNFYRGVHTPLDELDVIEEAKPKSANAMDPNWGGPEHTQGLIDSGFYKDNEIHHY